MAFSPFMVTRVEKSTRSCLFTLQINQNKEDLKPSLYKEEVIHRTMK
jgi:hypothetical protein